MYESKVNGIHYLIILNFGTCCERERGEIKAIWDMERENDLLLLLDQIIFIERIFYFSVSRFVSIRAKTLIFYFSTINKREREEKEREKKERE